MRQFFATQEIPSKKLLIKDHKKINRKGEYSTRLAIPISNFTTTFFNAGYLGIKKDTVQNEGELIILHHCPTFQPELET